MNMPVNRPTVSISLSVLEKLYHLLVCKSRRLFNMLYLKKMSLHVVMNFATQTGLVSINSRFALATSGISTTPLSISLYRPHVVSREHSKS